MTGMTHNPVLALSSEVWLQRRGDCQRGECSRQHFWGNLKSHSETCVWIAWCNALLPRWSKAAYTVDLLTRQRELVLYSNMHKHSLLHSPCYQGTVFCQAPSKCAHPSQSEGPDDVLRKGLHLYTSHFEVTINFCVVRPVLVALDLNTKWECILHQRKIKAWGYVTACTAWHHIYFQNDHALLWLVMANGCSVKLSTS